MSTKRTPGKAAKPTKAAKSEAPRAESKTPAAKVSRKERRAIARNAKKGGKTAPAAAAPAPIEHPAKRAARLAPAAAAGKLTLEGVATHRVEIVVFAYTAEQADRIAKKIHEMFTGSEARIVEIDRPAPEVAAAHAPAAPAPAGVAAANAETGAAGVTAPASEPAGGSRPEGELLNIPAGEFRDKANPACVVTVIGSTAKEFRVKQKDSGAEWNVPNVLFGAAYEAVPNE